MKKLIQNQAIAIPMKSATCVVRKSPARYLPAPHCNLCPANESPAALKQNSMLKTMNKLGKKADDFASGVREHVRLAPKISETVKGKLSLGAKILQVGGVESVFKQLFSVGEDEKLLKASQCYLSTTAGPIAGLLFISTHKVAFCSERSIKFSTPNGKAIRVHYKVVIPVKKIQKVYQSENVERPREKYIQAVTTDGFDFWFMGFLNYHKAFKYLLQAISQNSV